MGNKYDRVISRIKGIKDSIPSVVDEMCKDKWEDLKAPLYGNALVIDVTVSLLLDSIDGELSDESDEDVARRLLMSHVFTSLIAKVKLKGYSMGNRAKSNARYMRGVSEIAFGTEVTKGAARQAGLKRKVAQAIAYGVAVGCSMGSIVEELDVAKYADPEDFLATDVTWALENFNDFLSDLKDSDERMMVIDSCEE